MDNVASDSIPTIGTSGEVDLYLRQFVAAYEDKKHAVTSYVTTLKSRITTLETFHHSLIRQRDEAYSDHTKAFNECGKLKSKLETSYKECDKLKAELELSRSLPYRSVKDVNVGTELTGIDMVPPEETENLRREVKSLKNLNAKLQEKLKRRKVKSAHAKNSRDSAPSSSEEYTLSELSKMFENVKARSAKYKLRSEELAEKNKFLEMALQLYIRQHGPLSEIEKLYAPAHEAGADSSDDGIAGVKRYKEQTNSESPPKKRRGGVDKSVLSGSSSISSSSVPPRCTPPKTVRSFVLKTSLKTPEVVQNSNAAYLNLSKNHISYSNNSTDVEGTLSVGTRIDQKHSNSPVIARSIKIEAVDFSAHFGSHEKPDDNRRNSSSNVGGGTHKLQFQGAESGIPHSKTSSSYSEMPSVTAASDEVKPKGSAEAIGTQTPSSIIRPNVAGSAQEKRRQISWVSNKPINIQQEVINLSQQSDTTCIEETPPKIINLLPRQHPFEQDTSSLNRMPISPSMVGEYTNARNQFPDETLHTVPQYYERGNGLLSPGSVGLSVLDTLPQYGWNGNVSTQTMLSSQNVATKSNIKTFDVKQKGKLESEPKMATVERKSSISRSPVHFNISESIPRDLEEGNYQSNRVRRGSSVDMFDNNLTQSSSIGSPLDALLERDPANVNEDEHSKSDINDDAVISQQDFDTFHQHHISQGVRNIDEMESWLNSQASNTDGTLVLGNQEKEYLKVLAMQKSMIDIDELIESGDSDHRMNRKGMDTDELKLETSDGANDRREIIDLTRDEAPIRNSKAPQHRPNSRRNPISYKYEEVVRNKEARKQMHGITCDVCRKFYEAGGFVGSQLQDRLNHTSRHRTICLREGEASTPEEFWDIGFPSTQEVEESNRKRKGKRK